MGAADGQQNVICRASTARPGDATVNPETLFSRSAKSASSARRTLGGKNWPSGTYSPLRQRHVLPAAEHLHDVDADAEPSEPRLALRARNRIRSRRNRTNVGTIHAISVETGKTSGSYEQRAGMMSLMSTAGGLVFGGDTNGRFRAFDQRTGEVLWEVNLGSPSPATP